jgi:ABC-type transport system involved in multi-copper enzyme maturation permease subunit
MLAHFHFGLLTLVMVLAIYYSGTIVHRERDSGMAEIVAASPYVDWVMVTAKSVALWLIVCALLVTAMVTAIICQLLSGYTNFEIPLYLTSLFVHNGFYYAMLCVLAVAIQTLASKWPGTLSVSATFVVLMSLEELGVGHPGDLQIPYAIYSDITATAPPGRRSSR